jgi:hypothetical protein
MKHLLAAALAFGIVSCRERPAPSAGSNAADTSPMAGMNMEMQGMKMMPAMRAHMDSMGTASADRMKAMMAGHQEMASGMMDAMGTDMRMMSMSGDSAWTALSDSVRRDLAELPGMSGRPFSSRMKEHLARMQRLMDQHENMMSSMK